MTIRELKKTYRPVEHIDPARLPASMRPFAFLISDVDRDGAGYFFGLVDGYICTSSETHQIMESTLTACVGAMSDVEPCHCAEEECQRAWKQVTSK